MSNKYDAFSIGKRTRKGVKPTQKTRQPRPCRGRHGAGFDVRQCSTHGPEYTAQVNREGWLAIEDMRTP